MTSHELAKKLLEMEDLPVLTEVSDMYGDCWFEPVSYVKDVKAVKVHELEFRLDESGNTCIHIF